MEAPLTENPHFGSSSPRCCLSFYSSKNMDVKKFSLLLLFPLIRGSFNLLPQLQLSSVKIKVHEDSRTWADAQSHCKKFHVDLFRITSWLDNTKLQAVSGWIGLYRDEEGGEWKWSGRNQTLPKTTYDLIGDLTLENLEGNCVYLDQGDFKGDDCSEKHFFTCFEETLLLVRRNKTWEEALDHCRSLRERNTQPVYDLVSLLDDDDPDFAWQTAEQATTDEVWIGLRFLAGSWWWVTGEAMKNSTFTSCPADGACAFLDKNSGALRISSCSERRNFLCGKTP